MFGKLLSTVINVVTLPLDAANAGMDILSGGNGSKRSRNSDDSPLAALEQWRDQVSEAAEEIDEK
ncbi:MAG: hypothetical protein WAW39_16035 [Prosthecobacter sp.]|uniref:hypothetical protein n=1 Tax=Prosthecobacter sp. TaxID=1965333 RepID=UPI003BAEE83B